MNFLFSLIYMRICVNPENKHRLTIIDVAQKSTNIISVTLSHAIFVFILLIDIWYPITIL